MYGEKILEIISPMTIFATSILGRHCATLGKKPAEITRDDLPYLAVVIERSVGLFAGPRQGQIAGKRIQKLRGSNPSIDPSSFTSER